jgi:hypothetical protein
MLVLSSVDSSPQVRPSLPPEQIVNQMVKAELAARETRQHFLYKREAAFPRTSFLCRAIDLNLRTARFPESRL